MNKHEITTEVLPEVLHELQQAKTISRIALLQREIAQTEGNIERLKWRKKQNKSPRAPTLDKLEIALKGLKSEASTLSKYIAPLADGKSKTDRANGTN